MATKKKPAKKKDTTSQAARAQRAADKIKKVEEVNAHPKILAYARNKQGKTVFLSKWPKVLIIDIDEQGSRSAVGRGAHVIETSSYDEVGDVYWFLKAGNHDFETVGIDTTTALGSAALRKVMGDAEIRDPTREKSQPDQRTYGRANQLVNQLILQFRNLPMNVVFLAQEKLVKDEEEETTLHTVQMTPGTRGTLLGAVGLIGRIYLKEVEGKGGKPKWTARMLVGPHEEYDTGNRISLPRIIPAEPKHIIKAWQATLDEEE